MAVPQQLLEYQVRELKSQLDEARRELHDLESEFRAFVEDQHKREKNQLKWGISFLGAAAIALGGVLWQYVSSKVGLGQ